jgi:hypothetical protein
MSTTCRRPDRRIGEKGKRRGQSGTSAGIQIGTGNEVDRQLEELQFMLLGATALAYAKVNGAFHEELRKALAATVTDPEDIALLPEFFPLSCPRMQ